MKALIERPIHQNRALAEWHRARADVAGGRDVSEVSTRSARQRGGHGSGESFDANTGAPRTHTNSDSSAGAPTDVEKRVAYFTLVHTVCASVRTAMSTCNVN